MNLVVSQSFRNLKETAVCTPFIVLIMTTVVTRERRPSCFDTTRPTYNLLLTPVNNDLAEKLPDDLQVSKIIMMIILINYDYDNDDDLMIVAHPCKQRPC